MSKMRNSHQNSLRGGVSVAALMFGASLVFDSSEAAAISVRVESGVTTALSQVGTNVVDTFVIDATNDGEGNAFALTFAIGNSGLTVTSDGLDASGIADLGELGAVISADNIGTAVLTLGDATNGDDLTLVVTGNITGDVGTDANDLDTIVNSTGADTGNSTLSLKGNVVVGTGTITLTGDANDLSVLEFSGTGAQTSDAAIVAAGDTANVASKLTISNTSAAGVTISDIIGVGTAGLGSVQINTGSTLTQKLGVTDAGTFDVVGNVDNGSGGAGGTLTLSSGDAVTIAVGGVLTLATITGATNLTTFNITAGDGALGAAAATAGAGGAITDVIQTGTTTVTNLNISGGAGGNGLLNSNAAIGGAGGAVSAGTFAGAITATSGVLVTGGAGGFGGAGGGAADGSAGGAGGAVTITNFTGGIVGNLTVNTGVGGAGGAAATSANVGGAGADGGAVTLSAVGNVSGTINLNGADGGVGGVGGGAAGGLGGNGGLLTATLAGTIGGALVATAGDGADGGDGVIGGAVGGGNGGVGGAFTLADITGATSRGLSFTAGSGGTGAVSGDAAGGDGGAGGVLTVTDVNAVVTGNVSFTAGSGGAGGLGTGAGAGGAGGAGGQVATSEISTAITGNVAVAGGAGGAGSVAGAAGAGGAGGVGGRIQGLTFDTIIVGDVSLSGGDAGVGGDGGAAADNGGAGAVGGAITATDIAAGITGALSIASGDGSAGGAGAVGTGGAGAAGGAVLAVTVAGVSNGVTVTTGAGGAGAVSGATGSGGASGAGGAVVITDIDGSIGANGITVTTGAGGAGGAGGAAAASTAGSDGGAFTLTDVSTTFTIAGNISLTAGNGGEGGAGGAVVGQVGGIGGAILVSDINAPITGNFTATGGDGAVGGAGGATNAANGGAGGTVTTTSTTAIVGNVSLIGGASGSGGNGSATAAGTGGNGGAGGAVSATFGSNITGTVSLDDGTVGAVGTTGTAAGGTAGAIGTATLSLTGAAQQTISGVVTAGADGEGAIIVNNTTAGANDVIFSSAVGTTDAALLSLTQTSGDIQFADNVFIKTITGGATHNSDFNGDVTAATALTLNTGAVTFAGDVTAGTSFNFAGAGTVTLDGTTAQTITGNLTSAAQGTGAITVSNSTALVTFASKIGVVGAEVGTITTAAGTNTKFSDTVDAGALSLAGSVEFNGLVTTDSDGAGDGSLAIAANTTLTIGTGVAAGSTLITAQGNVSDGTGIIINMPSNLASGSSITILDAAGGTTTAGSYTATNNGLFTFATVIDDVADTVVVTATQRSAAGIAATLGINADQATALGNANTAVAVGDAGALAALNTVLVAGGAAAKNAAEQIAPQADTIGAGSTATVGSGSQVNAANSGRLASVRTGTQYASSVNGLGFAAGEGSEMNKAFWIKPFASIIRQDTHKGVSGFDADTRGLSGGIDGMANENVRLGVSLAYSDTDIEGKGTGKSQVDIKSYQMNVYGDYTADKFYIEGMAGYSFNDLDSSRTIAFGGINRTASATYDANQLMVSFGVGAPIKAGSDGAYFTPTVGLAYTNVSTDAFTETGAGGLNLNSTPDDVSVLNGTLGAKFHTSIAAGAGTFQPMMRLGLAYDFIGDDATTTAQYSGGGAAFKANGAETEQFSGNGGLGLAYLGDNYNIGANYDVDVKSDFIGHSASVNVKVGF